MKTMKTSIDHEEYTVDVEDPILVEQADKTLTNNQQATKPYESRFEAGPNEIVARNGEYYERHRFPAITLFRHVSLSGTWNN